MIQTISMVIMRSTKDPDLIRWHVRRAVTRVGKGTLDRVLAQGTFHMAPDPDAPLRPVQIALRTALADIEALACCIPPRDEDTITE